ncbi:MAG TPA: hypothetical protein VE621_02785 [Bryobacteraceae bacterium]|nr:hypothetical protein [Bryobacteraceae bacterium]
MTAEYQACDFVTQMPAFHATTGFAGCLGRSGIWVDLMLGLFAEPLPQGFGFSETAFRIRADGLAPP